MTNAIWIKKKNNRKFVDIADTTCQREATTNYSDEPLYFGNPLFKLPFQIRYDLTNEFCETGKRSISQMYFENLLKNSSSNFVQNTIQEIYYYSVRKKVHIVAWNIILIMSQLPFEKMGEWAPILALAATRNENLDIQELGVRCFENWENRDACIFLKQAYFSEQWLKDYANEVIEDVMEEGNQNVLFAENNPWEVAFGNNSSSCNVGEYKSRHGSVGVENRSKQVVGLES